MLGGAANTRPSPPIRRAISPVMIFSRNNLVGTDRDVNSRRRREDETLTDIQFECDLCQSGPIPIPPAVTAVLNTHPFFCIKQVRMAPILKHERDLVRLTCTQKHTNYNSDQHRRGLKRSLVTQSRVETPFDFFLQRSNTFGGQPPGSCVSGPER